jgi:hypothetical protein
LFLLGDELFQATPQPGDLTCSGIKGGAAWANINFTGSQV